MTKPFLTIFTPAFNRGHTLPRTYDSLQKQKCKEFIWLIIDDGSQDGTKELVKSWMQAEQEFLIQYEYKENGGMHTAHNRAYELIETELNICIDSDDRLAENAVEKIKEKWQKLDKKEYAGMIALDTTFDGKLIGKGFSPELESTTLQGYYAAGGSGDKKLIYRTDVIKQYPAYPVFQDERYVALAYKYLLIDQEYELAVLDEAVCEVEYQEDGSTNSMLRQYYTNPKGFACWRKLCMNYPASQKRLLIDSVHYVSSSLLAKDREFIKHSPRKVMTLFSVPLGFLLTSYIKWKNQALFSR